MTPRVQEYVTIWPAVEPTDSTESEKTAENRQGRNQMSLAVYGKGRAMAGNALDRLMHGE